MCGTEGAGPHEHVRWCARRWKACHSVMGGCSCRTTDVACEGVTWAVLLTARPASHASSSPSTATAADRHRSPPARTGQLLLLLLLLRLLLPARRALTGGCRSWRRRRRHASGGTWTRPASWSCGWRPRTRRSAGWTARWGWGGARILSMPGVPRCFFRTASVSR